MEDELDDKLFYQTYVSHVKIMSRVIWGTSLNISPLAFGAHLWRLFRAYILRPEVLLCGFVLLAMLMYLRTVDLWSRNLLGRLQSTLGRGTRSKSQTLSFFSGADLEHASWEFQVGPIAAFAVQGRRPKMEDRFVINDNINNTGVSLFAVFDGHGGEFAANYAKENLAKSLHAKVAEIKDFLSGKIAGKRDECPPSDKDNKGKNDSSAAGKIKDPEKPTSPSLQERRKSFKKTASTTDECIKSTTEITDAELLSKLDNLRAVTREVRPSSSKPETVKDVPLTHYFDKTGRIDYGKLITDEVLAADRLLIEIAKKTMNVAGTTALIAILEGSKLVVANVGDSRGVMCDSKGNAIPLSFDHKPQQMRERKRIKEAGGSVIFNGVWRVAGILATSRALGDYPLKDKKLVIADPDILTFDLDDHRPQFVVLASDGLWDTFSNEEAVAFIKERLHEPDFGAKSLTLQSYYRGSLDNITVLVINFRDGAFSWHEPTNSTNS